MDKAVVTGGNEKVFINEGTTNEDLPRPSEGCEVQKLTPDVSNWSVWECKAVLDPEHMEMSGKAVVAAEPNDHAVAAACAEGEACTTCKAT